MLKLKKPMYTTTPKTFSRYNIKVGVFSIIEVDPGESVLIGNDVCIGHHVYIESNVFVAEKIVIDSYSRICFGTQIGKQSQILYGAKIFENVLIGERCIISGELCDRTVIGNDVTFMGKIIHSYNKPGNIQDWDHLQQPSPIIGNNVVIGEAALIMGEVQIGDGSYIAAGEIVKCSVPPRSLFLRNQIIPIDRFRGLLEART